MAEEKTEEATDEQVTKRGYKLQVAEKVVKTPNIIDATDTKESDTEKALKILLGEEK